MTVVYLHHDRGVVPLYEPSDDQVTLLVHFFLQISRTVRLQRKEVKPGFSLRDLIRDNWQGLRLETQTRV